MNELIKLCQFGNIYYLLLIEGISMDAFWMITISVSSTFYSGFYSSLVYFLLMNESKRRK